MKRRITLSVVIMLVAFSVAAQVSKCPIVKVEAERLADLNTPRYGHSAFYVNGEVVVVGGHTAGFVPTATAEYFSDGEWHEVETVYPHDDGFAIVMKSGQVTIAGGHAEPLGIGQTFNVERYNPQTHTFRGFSSLNKKRARSTAIELADGRVIICGNWHNDDEVEVFDGTKQFSFAKAVSSPRVYPMMFRCADDDVLIVGAKDNTNSSIDTIVVDRLKGEPFRVSLFDTWRPYSYHNECDPMQAAFIGNEAKGEYAYLFPVEDSEGQVAVARVQGTEFKLLSTDHLLPMEGEGGRIEWLTYPVADTLSQHFYLTGCDKDYCLYVARIDYSQSPAPVTIYYTDPQFLSARVRPVLTPEGDLIFTGGVFGDHFEPHAAAYVLHIGERGKFTSTASWWCWTLWILAILTGIAIFGIVVWLRRRRKSVPAIETSVANDIETNQKLLERIDEAMINEQLFLNPALKPNDIATIVGFNSRYISDCINSVKGCSFSQYVNGYRVEHAKQLLREKADIKISTLYTKTGFTNERSFFRAFKLFTGMTPSEWMTSSEGQ